MADASEPGAAEPVEVPAAPDVDAEPAAVEVAAAEEAAGEPQPEVPAAADPEAEAEDFFPEASGAGNTALDSPVKSSKSNSRKQVSAIDDEPVTAEEIRAFRTSMTARRFPALRDLRDEDIEQLVRADRRMRLRTREGNRQPSLVQAYRTKVLSNPNLAHLAFTTIGTQESDRVPESLLARPPFSPVNPAKARADIQRKGPTAYVAIHSPYEMDKVQFLTMKEWDEAQRGAAPFCPTGLSGAADTIEVDYFLNSADTETLARERAYIKAKATGSSEHFLSGFTRGQGFPQPIAEQPTRRSQARM